MTSLQDVGIGQPQRGMAIGAVLGAMSLVVLDAGIANVALPTMAHALAVAPAQAILVVTAYQTALVMALLPCAALGERFGYRMVFTGGVAVFAAASVLCAISTSLPALLAARFVQGLGGAAVMALGVALLRFTVPRDQLGRAIGWNALTVALSAAASPAIGAAILSVADWPWLYAINLPLGFLVLAATHALPIARGAACKIDLQSMALNAGAFGALVFGAESLPTRPLGGSLLMVLAFSLFAALVRREAPKATPLFPLDLLRGRPFRLSVIASVCCFTGQTAGIVALPFYLQHGLGQSTLITGLYIMAWPLSVAASAVWVGRISERVSTALLCAIGGTILAIGLLSAALWPLGGDPAMLGPLGALCGFGFALFQTPNNRNMFLSAPRERSGAAGGMQATARLTGQTAGAVLMTLLFALMPINLAPRIGLGIGAVLALAGGLVSLWRARPS
jgi:DHA2 family multidrug resistance protein-like MFS transporter